jgi:hypothetical protein
MAGCGQKQIPEQGKSPKPRRSKPEQRNSDHTCQKSGEDQRMRESTMTPKVTVTNTKSKPDHVKIGKHGAHHTRYPNTFGHLRSVEKGPDTQGGDRVRECRCHCFFLQLVSCSTLPSRLGREYFYSRFPNCGIRRLRVWVLQVCAVYGSKGLSLVLLQAVEPGQTFGPESLICRESSRERRLRRSRDGVLANGFKAGSLIWTVCIQLAVKAR